MPGVFMNNVRVITLIYLDLAVIYNGNSYLFDPAISWMACLHRHHTHCTFYGKTNIETIQHNLKMLGRSGIRILLTVYYFHTFRETKIVESNTKNGNQTDTNSDNLGRNSVKKPI